MRCRAIFALLFAASLFTTKSASLAQTNILLNGDFEADPEGTVAGGSEVIDVGTIAGWRTFAVGGATGMATVTSAAGKNGQGIELTRADAIGGDSAIDKDDPLLLEVIPAEERIYKLTVDVRDGGAFSGTTQFGAELQFSTPAVNVRASFDPSVDFETFGLSARSDAGGTLSARFGLLGGGNQSVHVDNATAVDATNGVNRLVNGGFENSPDRVVNWRFFDTTGVSGTASLSSDAHTGSKAALLDVTTAPIGGDVGLDVDPFRVATLGGERLTLSLAAKTVTASSVDTRLKASVAGFDATGTYTGEILTELVNPSFSEYEEFSFEFDVPQHVFAVNIGFRALDSFFNVPTAGSYLIDDVSVLRPVETLPSDLDGNLIVDGADFLLIQRGYGVTTGAADIEAWKAAYGSGIPLVAAIPEPATSWLALVALAGLRLSSRRSPLRSSP